MRALGFLGLLAVTAPAHGRPVDPQVPRSPSHVRDAQEQVGVAWLECLIAHYPEDIAIKTDKVGISAAFQPDGRKLRVDLTFGLARLDGTPVAPTPAEHALLACVEQRVEAQRFHRDGDGSLGPVGLVDPGWEYPVVDNGAIGPLVAARYIARHVDRVRSECPHGGSPLEIVVDVGGNGRVARLTAVTPNGDPHPASACLSQLLRKKLRFPAIGTASRLSATP